MADEIGYTHHSYADMRVHLWSRSDVEPILQRTVATNQSIIEAIYALEEQLSQLKREYAENPDPRKLLQIWEGDQTLNNLKKKLEDNMNIDIPASLSITDLVLEVTTDITEDALARCDVKFWDPNGEIYGSMQEGDWIKVEIGWLGGIAPRFNIQPVFDGIITNRHLPLSENPDECSITCFDKRVLLSSKKEWKSVPETGDDDAFKKALNKKGIAAILKGGGEKSLKIIANRTELQFFVKTARANGQRVLVVPVNGNYVVAVIPRLDRKLTYTFTWGINIISLDILAEWVKPDDEVVEPRPPNTDYGAGNVPNNLQWGPIGGGEGEFGGAPPFIEPDANGVRKKSDKLGAGGQMIAEAVARQMEKGLSLEDAVEAVAQSIPGMNKNVILALLRR